MDVNKARSVITGVKNIFAPLESEVWFYLMIVLSFYGCFIYAVKKIHEEKLIREYLRPKDLFPMFMKQDIILPKNGGLRIALGMMMIFALMMSIAYESMITSSFITKKPQKKLESLSDLKNSGFRFGGPKFIRQFFHEPTDLNLKYLYDR